MNRELTPYDTGDRLQPLPWVSNYQGGRIETDKDRYGKVDLENDESATVMVVWAQRNADGYELHVEHAGGEAVPVVQYPDLGRVLQLHVQPLSAGHILGLREPFATAEEDGVGITFSHGFGFGNTSLAIEADFPDGSHLSESVSLTQLLQQWAAEVVTEYTWRKQREAEEKGA